MKRVLENLKKPIFWLIVIICLGFYVRLYKIDNPIADWHSWRQADTAAVARNFFKEGFNPLYPRYDDMTGIAENPVPNKERFRYVEFPIYNSLVYFAYALNGSVDERLARLISITFSLGSIVFIYIITKQYFSTFTALLSAFLFATLPFNIYFSRVILPEPALVFFCLSMFYFVNRWIRENTIPLFLVSVLFTICAFLTKPMAIFYLLPLFLVYRQTEGRWWPIPKRYFFYFVLSFLPFILWRIWINQHPEGIPASNWLFNGNHIRFKPAFWRWILADRFGREILGVTGTFLFFLGLLKKPSPKEGYLLHVLALSSLLYLIVFATGNVQHDYYQTLIIPSLVIFVAKGFVDLCTGIPNFAARLWTIPLAILFLTLTLYFGWVEVKGLYQINNPIIVEAGKMADKLLPKKAVVIAPYNGDTSFLYQTNRYGWPVVAYPVKDLIDMFGASYFVSTTRDAKTAWVMRKYTTIFDNGKFFIVDLTKESPNFDFYHDIEPM